MRAMNASKQNGTDAYFSTRIVPMEIGNLVGKQRHAPWDQQKLKDLRKNALLKCHKPRCSPWKH